jgi:hypothetical protein
MASDQEVRCAAVTLVGSARPGRRERTRRIAACSAAVTQRWYLSFTATWRADGGGGGLGLAITRGVVEAHSGAATVENTEIGCRFRLRLPTG